MWTLEVSDKEKMLPVMFELAAKLEPEHGITIRHVKVGDLISRRWSASSRIYNEAWKENWGFVPLRVEEMVHSAKESRPVLHSDWLMIAEDRAGEIVAFALTALDVNQVFSKLNGRLLPFGWMRFLWGMRRIDRVRVGFLGVRPDKQHTGVAAGLYVEHFETCRSTPPCERRRDRLDPRDEHRHEPRDGGDERAHRQEVPAVRAGVRHPRGGQRRQVGRGPGSSLAAVLRGRGYTRRLVQDAAYTPPEVVDEDGRPLPVPREKRELERPSRRCSWRRSPLPPAASWPASPR